MLILTKTKINFTIVSSGSSFIPYWNPGPKPAGKLLPSSLWNKDELNKASLRFAGGALYTKWLPLPIIVFIISFKKAPFLSSSPKLIISMLTFSFLRSLLNLISSAWSATTGLPTNRIILGLWFLLWRCLSANYNKTF